MRVSTPSFSELIDSRLRSVSTSHIEPHLLGKISPEMLEQLRLEGLRHIFILPFMSFGLMKGVDWLFAVGGYHYEHDIVFWTMAVLLAMMAVMFPSILRGPLDREIQFYRQRGRWRWER